MNASSARSDRLTDAAQTFLVRADRAVSAARGERQAERRDRRVWDRVEGRPQAQVASDRDLADEVDVDLALQAHDQVRSLRSGV